MLQKINTVKHAHKTLIICLTILLMGWISACHKDSPIVGTWTASSFRELFQQDGVTISDTTYAVASSNAEVIIFRADGTMSTHISTGANNGTYIYSGGKTVANISGSIFTYNVITLNAHLLTLEKIDTFRAMPLVIRYIFFSYSR